MRSPSEAPASPRTGKLSAQLTDEVPFAFPPQGEGGPLAVDEVPERSEGFSLLIEKDLIRHPPRVRSADATFPVRGEGFDLGRFLRLSKT